MPSLLFYLKENSSVLFYGWIVFLAINDAGDTLELNDDGDELIL